MHSKERLLTYTDVWLRRVAREITGRGREKKDGREKEAILTNNGTQSKCYNSLQVQEHKELPEEMKARPHGNVTRSPAARRSYYPHIVSHLLHSDLPPLHHFINPDASEQAKHRLEKMCDTRDKRNCNRADDGHQAPDGVN
ncbi:hypothetical protein EYF80_011825 [Liparis tanakae]|uniref:Uncharacterized protein n=1 Tax=Liparis tanakae TaxID=230148 RepID=A0A4Z2IL28_9TELE|nr:hypothetical protein EYF80_011825 [Liparis tanakae]